MMISPAMHRAFAQDMLISQKTDPDSLQTQEREISGLYLTGREFYNLNLVNKRFYGCVFNSCNFTDASFAHSSFVSCVFNACEFKNTNLAFIAEASMSQLFRYCEFIACDFENALLRSSPMRCFLPIYRKPESGLYFATNFFPVGYDTRGYFFYGFEQENKLFIKAGCRLFDLNTAYRHWPSHHAAEPYIGEQCLPLVQAIAQLYANTRAHALITHLNR